MFEAPFADLLSAGVQFYAVLGNHDIRRGTDLQINYPGWNMAGRRFYAFSKGERLVEFFGLDSTALSGEARSLVIVEKAGLDASAGGELTAAEKQRLSRINEELGEDLSFINEQAAVRNAQLAWLNEALAKSEARWKVVFLHHGRSTLQPVDSPTGHQVQYVTAGASARLKKMSVVTK